MLDGFHSTARQGMLLVDPIRRSVMSSSKRMDIGTLVLVIAAWSCNCGRSTGAKKPDAAAPSTGGSGIIGAGGVGAGTGGITSDTGGATGLAETQPDATVGTGGSGTGGANAGTGGANVGTGGIQPDAAPDAAYDVAAEVGDANLGACPSPVSGGAAFGVEMTGTASFVSTSPTKKATDATLAVQIYFPTGRVAGGKVQLGMRSPVVPEQYFFGEPAVLAGDLSASLTVRGHDTTVTANLQPGDGGLVAKVTKNFSEPSSDVADPRTAWMLLCPSGEVPAPSLKVLNGVVSPIAPLALAASTPIPLDELASLRVGYPRGTVEVKVTAGTDTSGIRQWAPNYLVTPAGAFPPGEPLAFDASRVRDVLGRPVPITATDTRLLSPQVAWDVQKALGQSVACAGPNGCTSTVRLTWDGGLRDGMYLCNGGCTVSDGGVTIPIAGTSSGNLDGVFTLTSNLASKARVRLAVGDTVEAGSGCFRGTSYAGMRWGKLAAVGRDGELLAQVLLSCNGVMTDYVLDLPSSVAYRFLVLHLEGNSPVPHTMPPMGPPPVIVEAIEILD
jgi:hypothetical protein